MELEKSGPNGEYACVYGEYVCVIVHVIHVYVTIIALGRRVVCVHRYGAREERAKW